jgi:hypothetical protein
MTPTARRGYTFRGATAMPLFRFGLFNLISVATLITRGIEVRRTGRALDSVLPKAA